MYNDQEYVASNEVVEEHKNIDKWGYEEVGFDTPKLALAGALLYVGHSLIATLISTIIVFFVEAANKVPHVENISNFSGLIGGLICVAIFLFVIRKHLKPILKQFASTEVWGKALTYVGYMYVAIMAYSVIINLLNIEATSANQDSINTMMYLTPVIAGLYVCVLAPLIEELTFRFCFFRALSRKNEKVGFWVIACIFAGIHLLTSLTTGTFLQDLTTLPVYLVGGIGLTYAYYKEKKIGVSIAAHMIYNAISFLMNILNMTLILSII